MMKIGILTFHRSINTGAFIQCYSLQRRLVRDFPDAKIEIIDYYTRRVIYNYSDHLIPYLFGPFVYNNRSLKNKLIDLARRVKALLENPSLLSIRRSEKKLFSRDWEILELSDETLVSDSIMEFNNWIYGKYDIVIVGSDCVWQYISYPFPNAYFLHGDIGCKKISYAGCAYRMNVNDLNEEEILFLRESFSGYSYIGTRDIWTEQLMENLGVDVEYGHNCDPAFLLDIDAIPIDKVELKHKLEMKGVNFNKKLIGLQTYYSGIGKTLREIIDEENSYQIISIRNNNRYADVYIEELSPLEWSVVFGFFDLVVTNYFHGAIMSIVNGTIPIVIDTEIWGSDREKTRLYDLISRIGLFDYYYMMKNKNDLSKQWLKNVINESVASHKDRLSSIVRNESSYYYNFYFQLADIISDIKGSSDNRLL